MKKYLAIVLIALLLIVGLTACGKKTEEEVLPVTTVHVKTAADLVAVKDYVGKKYSKYIVELDNDIDVSNIDIWQPIGADADNAFCGVFDGKNHTISGLKVAGLDQSGAPKDNFVAKDKNVENVSSFASYGLFGYVKNAKIMDVKLTGVDMSYYVDHTGYSYVGAMAGISLGKSVFENIEVGGNVAISNLYRKYKTYDDRGKEQNVKDECTGTLYFGGLVGYSNGTANFKNVISHVNFDNYNYIAYWRDESTILSEYIEEGEVIEPKYVVDYHDTFVSKKLRQVIAGGVIGQMKGGSLTGGNYDGVLNVNSVGSYVAGLVGTAYSAALNESHVTGANINSKVKYKNASGGIAALLDGSTINFCTVENVNIDAQKLDADVMTMTEGGVFGYGTNLAKVAFSNVTGLRINVDLTNAEVGGVGGVMKDSVVNDCLSVDAKFNCSYATRKEDYNKTFGTVLGAVYANSTLKDCAGTATNRVNEVEHNNEKAYAAKGDSVYPNDRGEPAIRLYKKNSNSTYLAVDGKIEGNVLVINIYNEELTLLTTARYTREGGFAPAYNVAEEYVSKDEDDPTKFYYFDAGFVADDNGQVVIEGRDASAYEFRSGKSTVDNVVVATEIVKINE